MGFKGNVTIRDKVGKSFRVQEWKYIQEISKKDLFRIAKECERIIQETIVRKSKNPTGYLASFFIAEPIPNGWGIGDVAELDSDAPYWNHCLDPYTEVYVEIDNLVKPVWLKDLIVLWKNDNNIKILTPHGLKTIQNMWNVNLDSYYSFNISKWFSISMSGNHKLIYKLKNGYFEKTADSFGSAFRCYSTLFTTLKSVNEKIIDNVKIDNKIVKLDYLLGWMLGITFAEGIIGKNRIHIPQKNIDKLACYVTEFCRAYDYLPTISENYEGNCDRLNIFNEKIQSIIEYFISGKSYNKKFNSLFLNSPKEYRQGIIDGYQLGDGRQSTVNNYEIRTASEELRNQLILIGSSLGYDCSIWKDLWQESKKAFKSNYFTIGGNILNHCRKYNVIKNKCTKIGKDRKSLERDKLGRIKKQIYKEVDFNYYPKSITNIQKVKKKVTFIDLQVEGELFLINGGIVSHNCDKGSLGIGANWNHTLPKGRWVGGRWVKDDNGYFAKPKTPIPAMNYISSTLAQMEIAIPTILKG